MQCNGAGSVPGPYNLFGPDPGGPDPGGPDPGGPDPGGPDPGGPDPGGPDPGGPIQAVPIQAVPAPRLCSTVGRPRVRAVNRSFSAASECASALVTTTVARTLRREILTSRESVNAG